MCPYCPFKKMGAFSCGSRTSWIVLRLVTRNLLLGAFCWSEKSWKAPSSCWNFTLDSIWVEKNLSRRAAGIKGLWIAFQRPSGLGSFVLSSICPVWVPRAPVLLCFCAWGSLMKPFLCLASLCGALGGWWGVRWYRAWLRGLPLLFFFGWEGEGAQWLQAHIPQVWCYVYLLVNIYPITIINLKH